MGVHVQTSGRRASYHAKTIPWLQASHSQHLCRHAGRGEGDARKRIAEGDLEGSRRGGQRLTGEVMSTRRPGFERSLSECLASVFIRESPWLTPINRSKGPIPGPFSRISRRRPGRTSKKPISRTSDRSPLPLMYRQGSFRNIFQVVYDCVRRLKTTP